MTGTDKLPDHAASPNAALFPPRDDRRHWENHLTILLDQAEQRVARGAVSPTLDMAGFAQELAAFDFQTPMEFETLLAWTVARLETGLVHLNHPRYLGLFNPGPSFPAQCADRIVASFNPQLASSATSPAAVAIEAHVARAMAKRAGLPATATGHFTAGGSEANGTALLCALTRAEPRFASIGARAFAGQPVFYISADSHLAWIKLAHQAGVGRDAARLVPTDGQGRMSMPALAAMIASDQAAGCVPVMLAPTAGTTGAGMIDPLAACRRIADAHGMWLHVDAAWGGGLLASETKRPLLAGIEAADSITIDAHKWFATTMGCGMFLTAHPAVLSACYNVTTSFMPSHAVALDPYVTTAQWSRRFMGLRLFLSLAAGGWAAHAAHVESGIALVALLCQTMKASAWEVRNDPALAVACLAPPPGARPVREIVARINKSGAAWVSAAVFEGQDVIRLCVTHGETCAGDILAVADDLHAACGAGGD